MFCLSIALLFRYYWTRFSLLGIEWWPFLRRVHHGNSRNGHGTAILVKYLQEVIFRDLDEENLREIIKQKIAQKSSSDNPLTENLWQSLADDTKIKNIMADALKRGGSAEDALFALQQTFKQEAWQQIKSSF